MAGPRTKHGNALLAGGMVAVIAGMVGLSFAAVPLYRAFCQATGYGGTPKIGGPSAAQARASVNGEQATGTIAVRFDANTSPALPWRFLPAQTEMRVALGEDHVAFYSGRNLDAVPVTGVATYTVTPDKAAKYFHKTACFCFNEQTLEGGQDMQFPLSFWVDPAIATDPGTADIRTVTLSYTFFRSLDDAQYSGALAKAGPHVGPLVR